MPKPELETVQFATSDDWTSWLTDHHAGSPGVWLKMAKKASGITSIDHDQALEVAICFGWIDGQVRSVDTRFFRQRFTPRTARSKWSQVNCAKAEALMAAGRMQPAGQAQIDAARADGRWDAAYEPPSRATVPDDFQKALDLSPDAEAFFKTLRGSQRYAFLYRLHHVRSPDRRRQRIADYIAALSEGRTLN